MSKFNIADSQAAIVISKLGNVSLVLPNLDNEADIEPHVAYMSALVLKASTEGFISEIVETVITKISSDKDTLSNPN